MHSLFIVQVPEIKVIYLIRMLWLADYTFSLKGLAKWSESSIFFLTFFFVTGLYCLSHIFSGRFAQKYK